MFSSARFGFVTSIGHPHHFNIGTGNLYSCVLIATPAASYTFLTLRMGDFLPALPVGPITVLAADLPVELATRDYGQDRSTLNMSGFFEELKRRKVYRVAIAYVVASWALAQGLAQVLPIFDISNSVIRVVVVLLLIGFPVALVLAWVFDVTPQGIRATPKATPGTHRRRNIITLAAAGIVISAAAGFFLIPRATAHKIDKSIAVLPFQNLSDEKENAYFADGVQDDVLTNLSKIGDLKVISRMSVMSYRGDGARNAREIGKALGVGTLLEGSVRRMGNRVRVSVQLIDAENDRHLWAEDYDRDLTDVFAIQTDLARKIASALEARLSPNENARLDRRPTEDSDAYLLYVQAHDYANRPDHLRETSLKAEELYERTTKLDPNFALAFAGLSIVESWIYHSYEPIPARREKARRNADEALRLQPDLPEGHLALGCSYYYGDRDYQRALTELEIAKRDLPNEADAYSAIAAIQRRQGKWAESTANFEKSVSLDPKNASLLFNFGFNYMAQRDFETADKVFDRAIGADPHAFAPHGMKSALAILWKGDVDFAEKQLALVPAGFDPDGLVTASRMWVLTLQRKFAEALQVAQQFSGETLTFPEGGPCPKTAQEGTLYLYLGEKEKAHAAFKQAKIVAERLVRDAPDDPGRHAHLGAVLAGLGNKEDAIKEGKKAVELLPESQDAFDGPQWTAALAEIYAWVGEHDEAFRLLDHLFTVPSGLTAPMLKLDPIWDPLRKDPRFQALIDKYASKDSSKSRL